MIFLITGASHTGKTLLAQRILERYGIPYLSIDHLKMGLIRSGNTQLTPEDDDALTDCLWPIVREMVKTAIENRQNLTVEGCYVPFHWRQDFDARYLPFIRFLCLAMTDAYIDAHFAEIQTHASDIEHRLDDKDCTREVLKQENRSYREGFQRRGERVLRIDADYESALRDALDLFGRESMIEIRRIQKDRKADANLPNQPFPVWGKLEPNLEDGIWSYRTVVFPERTEMCFPDCPYDPETDPASFFGAYEGETCVGLAVLRRDMFRYLYLDDLKVRRADRGRGVGKLLLEACMDAARAEHMQGVYTIGQDNNLSACLFYLRNGFEIGGFDNRVYRGTAQEGKGNILFYRDCREAQRSAP